MNLQNWKSGMAWAKAVKEIGGVFLKKNGDIDYETLDHLGWKGNVFYEKLYAKYLTHDDSIKVLNEISGLDASDASAGFNLLSILGGAGMEMLRQRAEFKHQVENVLAVFRERRIRYNYIYNNMMESFNEQLVFAHSACRVVSVQSVDFCEPASAEKGEVWLGNCTVEDKNSYAVVRHEYFACELFWDKTGDAKYETNSYDRPIRLEGLWLHSPDYNNYLIAKN